MLLNLHSQHKVACRIINKLASNLKLSVGLCMHATTRDTTRSASGAHTRTLHASLHKHSEITRMNTRAAKVWGVRCWRSGGQKLEIRGQMLEVEYKVLDLN